MSRFSQSFEAHRTQRAKPLIEPMRVTEQFDRSRVHLDRVVEYRIVASFGLSSWVPDNDGTAIQLAIKRAQRQFVEHVFGEFRLPLIELEHDLANRDFDAAMARVQQILSTMFSTE